MVSDVRWDVLVMRLCAAERGVAGMRLRIVPVELLRAAPDLVTVADYLDYSTGDHQSFAHYQPHAAGKDYFSSDQRGSSRRTTSGSSRQSPRTAAVSHR